MRWQSRRRPRCRDGALRRAEIFLAAPCRPRIRRSRSRDRPRPLVPGFDAVASGPARLDDAGDLVAEREGQRAAVARRRASCRRRARNSRPACAGRNGTRRSARCAPAPRCPCGSGQSTMVSHSGACIGGEREAAEFFMRVILAASNARASATKPSTGISSARAVGVDAGRGEQRQRIGRRACFRLCAQHLAALAERRLGDALEQRGDRRAAGRRAG